MYPTDGQLFETYRLYYSLLQWFWPITISGFIATAFFTGHAANDKGRSGIGWWLLGLLFGPLALLAIAALGDRHQRRYLRFLAEKDGYKTPDLYPNSNQYDRV